VPSNDPTPNFADLTLAEARAWDRSHPGERKRFATKGSFVNDHGETVSLAVVTTSKLPRDKAGNLVRQAPLSDDELASRLERTLEEMTALGDDGSSRAAQLKDAASRLTYEMKRRQLVAEAAARRAAPSNWSAPEADPQELLKQIHELKSAVSALTSKEH